MGSGLGRDSRVARLNWGATPEEWRHWSETLGLTEDLLPVVCRPGAAIDPSSKIKSYGKVPCLYRPGTRNVIGMPSWTSRTSHADDLSVWTKEPDYGICLQTRHVRALDCDITDQQLAVAIHRTIVSWFAGLGADTPVRTRADSWKFLVLFELPGEYGKRTFKTAGGIVEFLANGQQCLVAGTHKDGARYDWNSDGTFTLRGLTPEQFEDLWDTLVLTYATEEPTISKMRKPRGDNPLARDLPHNTVHTDPVVLLLMGKNLVRDTDADGRVHFTCPWSAEHSYQGDITETTYFPENTNGYEKGHFLCLHAHCQARTDADFLDALGWTLDGFEAVPDDAQKSLEAFGIDGADDLIGPPPIVDPVQPLAIRPQDRDVKTGIVKAVLPAVLAALARPDLIGAAVEFDAFQHDTCITWRGEARRPLTDADYTNLRLRLMVDHRFDTKLWREMMIEAVHTTAVAHTFDSGLDRAASLPAWDGTPRVSTFYRDYLGVREKIEQPYAAACSRYLWTALAGRLLVPGVQVDMAPIWVGPQGSGKTSAVRAIALHEDHYVELDVSEPDNDLSRRIRGKVIGELAELKGLRQRELESVKAFISRRFEHFVDKYMVRPTTFYRRVVLVGTSNRDDFLVDDTGNRRFLPIEVGKSQAIGAIIKDREQLWAEAIVIFKREGVLWQEAESLARAVHSSYMPDDDWQTRIADWLDEKDLDGKTPREREIIRTLEVATQALHFNTNEINGNVTQRIGSALKKLGFARKTYRDARGMQYRGWRQAGKRV